MAVLRSDDLSVDFRYTAHGGEDGWVQYQFYFNWKDEPVFKDDVLKRWSSYWGARPTSAFLANEFEADGLIPLIRKVLDSDQPDYWEALEPDIVVAIYPEMYFPFLPHHHKLIRESESFKARRVAREKEKAKHGKLPDDSFTVMFFVDAYNFKEADAYYGQGFSLNLIVERHELERFYTDLIGEYAQIKQQ